MPWRNYFVIAVEKLITYPCRCKRKALLHWIYCSSTNQSEEQVKSWKVSSYLYVLSSFLNLVYSFLKSERNDQDSEFWDSVHARNSIQTVLALNAGKFLSTAACRQVDFVWYAITYFLN